MDTTFCRGAISRLPGATEAGTAHEGPSHSHSPSGSGTAAGVGVGAGDPSIFGLGVGADPRDPSTPVPRSSGTGSPTTRECSLRPSARADHWHCESDHQYRVVFTLETYIFS